MTRFTELVGCTEPIQLAAMARVVTPALAAGVSNAGGLGMLAIGRGNAAAATRQIDAAVALTDRPLGAGFIVLFLDRGALEEAAARLPVVELFWGWPEAGLVLDDVITGWQVGSVDEARAAVDAGCRYVVAQGVEAGGHGRSTTPVLELLPAVRAVVDVPVVAAGGIGDAAGVRRMLDAGADGVRIGTRFIATHESDAHDFYVGQLIAGHATDTVVTERFDVGWPDAPVRVLASSLQAALDAPDGIVATMTNPDGSTIEIPRFSTSCPTRGSVGNLAAMANYAGTSIDAVTARQPVADVMAELTAGIS